MSISSLENLARDRGIDVNTDRFSSGSDTPSFTQPKKMNLHDLAKQYDITPQLDTTTIETEPKGRGILGWLQTGEYYGVGVLGQTMEAAKTLMGGTNESKLKAAFTLLNPLLGATPAGIKGVQEEKTLRSIVEPEIGREVTKAEGFGLDIAQIFTDPTLYGSLGLSKLPKIGLKYGKEIPVLGKVLEKATDAIGEKFIFKYKAPQEYVKRAAERLVRIAGGQEAAEAMAKRLTRMPGKKIGKYGRKLTIAEQQMLGDIITGQVTNADPTLMKIAEPAIQALEQLGKDAVETGLMTTETFLKRAGEYMPRLYRKKELTERLSQFFTRNTKIKGERFLERGDLTDEAQQALGVIEEAAYPVAKGIRDLTFDIETAKWLKWVNAKYAKSADEIGELGTEGLEKLADSKAIGDLSGKWVPKFVADDINQLVAPTGSVMKGYKKLLNSWKVGKTVLNPAYHGRNTISNFILNDINGVSIFNPKGAKAYGQAIAEIKSGGKFLDEAKESGLLGKTFYGEDLKDFIDNLDTSAVKGVATWVKSIAQKTAQFGGKYQSLNEDVSKLAHFIFQRKAGKSVDEAMASANKALFDYGALTSFEQKIKNFIPFYTFNRKAWPMVTQIAVDSPGRIGKYTQLKEAIEGLSPETEEERRWMPEWMRNSFNMRLPFKDKNGDSLYFDLTYVLPYGDVVSGFTRDGVQGVARQVALMLTPIAKEFFEQALGKDLYFDRDIEMFRNQKLFGTIPTDARLAHALRTFAPQVYNDFSDKLLPALQGKTDYAGRDLSVGQTIGSMLGLKTNRFNLEKAKKALPYELGEKLDPIESNIYQTEQDKSLTEEERKRELEKWNRKKQEILDQYPGVAPKKRIWIEGNRE